MGRADRDRNELEALQDALAELDGMIAEAARAVSVAARDKAVTASGDAWTGAAGRLAEAWSPAASRFASRLNGLSARIDAAMAPLEDKPQPSLRERVRLSLGSALFRLTAAKSPLDPLAAVLVELDGLQSVLSAYRQQLLAARHSVEADLIELGGHRPLLVERLAERALAEGEPTAALAVAVEANLQEIQHLTVELNRQVSDANILINKLAIEAERAILLRDVLSPDNPELLVRQEWPDLPHLAPLTGLRESGMLSSIEIDRRRSKIDARFLERFDMNMNPQDGVDYRRSAGPEVHHA